MNQTSHPSLPASLGRPSTRLSLPFRAALITGSFLAPQPAWAGEPPTPPAVVAPAPTAAAAASAPARAPAKDLSREARACELLTSADGALAEAFAALRTLAQGKASFDEVRLSGLQALREDELLVWAGVGRGPLSLDEALVLVAQLRTSGLFAALEPGVGPGSAGGAALDLRLVEHATVRAIRVRGLQEEPTEEILARLVDAPSEREVVRSREPEPREERNVRKRRRARLDDEAEPPAVRCPAPLPPRAWLAWMEDGALHPGVLWRGLPLALERTVGRLRDDGYLLATATADVSANGEARVELDEGRLESFEVRGLKPRLAAEVERELGFRKGDVFSTAELRRALDRARDRFPFLERSGRRFAEPPAARFHEETAPDGSRAVRPVVARREEEPGAAEAKPARGAAEEARERVQKNARAADAERAGEERARNGEAAPQEPQGVRAGERNGTSASGSSRSARDRRRADEDRWSWDDFDWEDVDWSWEPRGKRVTASASWRRWRRPQVEVTGAGRVTLWLQTRGSDSDGEAWQLLRHTPVTGFAPGLAGTLHLWDPADRVHLSFDGLIAFNTRRTSWDPPEGSSFFERAGSKEKVDWLVGLRLSVPTLRVAELGVQLYTLTDTADRWRIGELDSYLWSALINRPDADYFRRTGFTALATLHLFDSLTLGGELRVDRVWGLNPPGKVWTLFRQDEAPLAPALVGPGELDVGSVLLRADWSTDRTPLHRVGGLHRDPERALARDEEPLESGFATHNTLELGSPALAGGGASWLRVVSDNLLALDLGGTLVRLRVRGAGGRDLPLHKQEGLGGFGALRGYDFKEFRGDGSLLGNLEVRGRHFGAFVDAGSVHQEQGWIEPKLGAGLQFFFDKRARVEAAWRLDDKARGTPELRFLFGWER